jgi:glycosyltransferase involved in cell wall biosynthesis
MKLSVIVPTFRRPELLKRCLLALCNQQFEKTAYEIIVVTDGPDAETRMIVESEAAKTEVSLRCFALPEKKGPAAARNLGWQSARGRLILFTDDDCIPSTIWISSFYEVADGRELAAFTGKVNVPISDAPTDFEKNTQGLETAEFITANCACTIKALQLTGGFDERFTMAWREDSDLEFKLLKAGISILRVESAVVTHPVRKAPWGVSLKEQKKGIFNALLYKKFPELYREKIQSGIAWNYIWIIVSFSAGVLALATGHATTGFYFLMIWFGLTAEFINRRLKGTSRSWSHVGEMILTSLAIPFLSLYWQLYGAIKYRVVFL